ncbi:hypothetical protein [Vibrio sp. R78045]|uniref:hypothetical protein n=1 Tax=Vibrio sp. R78045 TaxID=3093868 RepID=UPI0036F417C0
MKTITLTKFDVAERQLLQAIRMFFREEDVISIHTLAEAANQVLSDIGSDYDTKSIFRENDRIREDKKKEWLRHMFKSRNFFKHADRDKCTSHEFRPDVNHFSLLDGVSMYSSIKQVWVPETLIFQLWFSANYPELMIEESAFNQMVKVGLETGQFPNPKEKSLLSECIQAQRNGHKAVSGVNLEYGL